MPAVPQSRGYNSERVGRQEMMLFLGQDICSDLNIFKDVLKNASKLAPSWL